MPIPPDSRRLIRALRAAARGERMDSTGVDPSIAEALDGVIDRIDAMACEIAALHESSRGTDNLRLYRETQDAVWRREEFMAIVSHELKTPLTTIQLRLQNILRMARRGADLPKVIDMVERAERQGRRLARLINELLDVSRITSGGFALEPEEMDLSEAARTVLGRFQIELLQHGYAVRFRPSPASGLWDRARIEQAITNLLSNAIKYGEGKPIEIRVGAQNDSALLEVKDAGMGIEPDVVARLFLPFERGVPSNHYGGLGLGLFIVRQIVEAHGGSVGVRSLPGRGSRFTIRLPVRVTSPAVESS